MIKNANGAKKVVMLPINIDAPVNMISIPRYIGFLVNEKGPVVTTVVGFEPGTRGVLLCANEFLPHTINHNPITIPEIPRKLNGKGIMVLIGKYICDNMEIISKTNPIIGGRNIRITGFIKIIYYIHDLRFWVK